MSLIEDLRNKKEQERISKELAEKERRIIEARQKTRSLQLILKTYNHV